MGKKIKKKAPIPGKVKHRASAGSPKSVLEGSSPNIGSVTNVDRDKEACNHCAKSTIELNWILLKIHPSSMDAVACEHCRRGGKEKGKNPKRKGHGTRAPDAKSNQNFMWVCLDCGQYFCGGEVSMLEPYGHARRHGKQERHQWTVRADNPLISWCYSCSSSVPIQLPQKVITEENKEVINAGSVKLSGDAVQTLNSETLKGYKVRGLLNLGNTCFFNSVMQNFFSMDVLRDALLGLDRPVGPLSIALRMLFVETRADSMGVVNPKALFGCICAKAPQFSSYQQQDSHELLRYLLDGLHMEETKAWKTSGLSKDQEKINVETRATLVDAIFGGCLSSSVSCMECGHTSVVKEPFLDLSLPVPLKKPPSKKVPPSKKSNQREKNKTRRFREMAVVPQSTMSTGQKVENNAQPSECSESEIVVPKQTHANTSEAPAYSWMDYLGDESPNCNHVGSHEFEASVVQCSWSNHASEIESSPHCVSELHKETETNVQSVSELHNETGCNAQSSSDFHTADYSNDLTVFSNTSIERSCNDEVLNSCIPIPGVILLSYKEQAQDFIGLDVNNRTSFFQDPDATNHTDNFISVSSSANTTCKQMEDDFDGFGDLFNEPEVTSDLKEDTIVSEDMDIALWNRNITVSMLKEVDDTSAPVSIYSCLALFTTPELLSDEQAWYCENCSKMLLQENKELRTSMLQASKVSDQPVTVKSMVNEDEFLSKRFASNSHWGSAIEKVLDHGKSASPPKNATLVEEHIDQIVLINTSHKPITRAEGSHNNEESNSNENLHLEEIARSSMASLLDVLDKEMLDSETSQYFSTPSAAVNNPIQEGESTFNGINDRSVGNDEKEPDVTSHSWQSCTNVALQKSSKDSYKEVGQGRRKGLKSGNAHPLKGNKGEGIKLVKRDATKRILIDKIPRILTIHLKRFSQDGRGRISKLSGHVRFEETLDMKPFMDPRCINDRTEYHLIGVVEHSGSMGGGHYVAYVRGNGRGSKASTGSSSTGTAWFYTSDAYVREVSLAEVLQSEAYILFYEKM